MSPVLSSLLVSIALAFLYWISRSLRGRKSATPFAPGPPADPIIGHARIVPADRPELKYIEWGKTYETDILYLNFLGQHVVVLNKAEDAIALLDKRGVNYSSRPKMHFYEEMGWEKALTILPFGQDFKKHRRMFQSAFTATNCLKFQMYQEQEARELVRRILKAPEKWRSETAMFAIKIILRIAYGKVLTNDDDYFLELAHKTSAAISDGGSAGATAVDLIPIVRYLPRWVSLIPTLSFAREYYSWVRKMHEYPFGMVEKEMENGNAPQSFMRKLMEDRVAKEQEKSPMDKLNTVTDEDIKGAGATLYTGGTDTTRETMACFVLAMVLHPDVQKKAWAEIDSAIGRDRLPTFADRPNLPFVERVVQETFRWQPVVPLSALFDIPFPIPIPDFDKLVVPHKSNADDTYKGFFIPKGWTLIIANNYAMTHDETIYSDPDTFNPDRYLSKSDQGLGEPQPVSPFGFGRRICPGQHLGTASVWMAIVTMLSTIEVSKAKDENGHDIALLRKMTTGLTSHPEEFPCVVRPRSSDVSLLIN